ncbi:MAG TPA: NUDIX domain-containing protein [Candidatus Nanoarchaeia archaeon]|nr:NUDIX domain-containing protein [Candidatus Nanoarchaeia archaeon]
MKTLLELCDRDIGLKNKKVGIWKKRSAVRCVLFRNNQVALLNVQKENYHKLPGGGIEDGEELESALHREVAEEVGSKIRIGKILGRIIEYKSKHELVQNSICFLAKEISSGKTDFTQDEIDDGFKVEWYSLRDAINVLKKDSPKDYTGKFIVRRDVRFLEEAMNIT